MTDNSTKPQIAFIVPGLGNMGGSVRVAINMANRLIERYRVAMISCTPFDQPAFPVAEGITLHTCASGDGRLREQVARMEAPLTELLGQIKPAVLFGIGTYESLMAIKPCRANKVKLVFCDHGALINQWADKQMRVIRFLCSFFAAKTVVLTTQSYNDYRKLLHRPARKMQVIANWIPQEMRERPVDYRAASKRALWAGRLDKEKGVDHLIDIAARVLPAHPDWTWDVYGAVVSGGSIDVVAAIEEAGIKDQLRLMGRVDNMYDIYDDYAICTLTSYREGLPLTLLEGQARALPLISFDVNTGPRDIIHDGEDGFLIPCYDCEAYAEKLGQMMDDQALLERMSARANETVDRFSEEAVYAQWLQLLKELGA